MEPAKLKDFYHRYLECLNNGRPGKLAGFVNESLVYNDKKITLAEYEDKLSGNFRDIPDLHFHAGLLVTENNVIACRLDFNCTPIRKFMGIPVNGMKVSFSEFVFYDLTNGRI